MVELAVVTGIAVSEWERLDDASLVTTLVVLEERARRGR